MLETYDYEKLGKTTWRCSIHRDNGDESYAEVGPSAEYPNKGLAKAWMNRTLPCQRRPETGEWWGRIERGTYIDISTDHALDACWEGDDHPDAQHFAHLADNRVDVDWEGG